MDGGNPAVATGLTGSVSAGFGDHAWQLVTVRRSGGAVALLVDVIRLGVKPAGTCTRPFTNAS